MAQQRYLNFKDIFIYDFKMGDALKHIDPLLAREIQHYDIVALLPGFLERVPVLHELHYGSGISIVKQERAFVFDRDYRLLVDVPVRKVVQGAGDRNSSTVEPGQSIRDAILQLHSPPDVRRAALVQIWHPPFPERRLVTVTARRSNYDMPPNEEFLWPTFWQLGYK